MWYNTLRDHVAKSYLELLHIVQLKNQYQLLFGVLRSDIRVGVCTRQLRIPSYLADPEPSIQHKGFERESNYVGFSKRRPFLAMIVQQAYQIQLHLITVIKSSFTHSHLLLSASFSWSYNSKISCSSVLYPTPATLARCLYLQMGILEFLKMCVKKKQKNKFASANVFLQRFLADFVFVTVVTAGVPHAKAQAPASI